MIMFSEEIESALRSQGWFPERSVSTNLWVARLVGRGFTVLTEAEKIMQNFGGLQIACVKSPTDAFAGGITHFDPVTEVLSEFDRIAFWQNQIGRTLTPIGVEFPSDSILLLADNGHVFSEWGNVLAECGSSFHDALESSLVFARRKPVILRAG